MSETFDMDMVMPRQKNSGFLTLLLIDTASFRCRDRLFFKKLEITRDIDIDTKSSLAINNMIAVPINLPQ
jgi:hypothetical protein